MMRICDNCGETFQFAKYYPVWVDDQFGGHREFEPGCPRCGSPDIDEAVECERCGEYVSEFKTVNGLCPSCVRKVLTQEATM